MRKFTATTLFFTSIAGCGLSAYTDDANPVSTRVSNTHEKSVLSVSLSIDVDKVAPGNAIPVQISLFNNSNSPAPFLPINTAFEEALSADVFEVVLDDELQPYLGIVARRLPPTTDDVLMIAADMKLERSINIAKYYKMDRAGEYHIRYTPQQLVVGAELGFDFPPMTIESDQVIVIVR